MLQSIASEVAGGGVVDQDAPLMDSGSVSATVVSHIQGPGFTSGRGKEGV